MSPKISRSLSCGRIIIQNTEKFILERNIRTVTLGKWFKKSMKIGFSELVFQLENKKGKYEN